MSTRWRATRDGVREWLGLQRSGVTGPSVSRVGAVDCDVEPPRWRWSPRAVARVASNGLGLRRTGCDRQFTVPVLGCFRSCPEGNECEAGSTWTWADVEGGDSSPRLVEWIEATPVAWRCQVVALHVSLRFTPFSPPTAVQYSAFRTRRMPLWRMVRTCLGHADVRKNSSWGTQPAMRTR